MIFRNWVLQNFPFLEDDFDALTDYELFCKMLEYVKEFAKDNEDFNKRLTNLENYINNLDLQDEVNNKLDEMTQDGTLENLIGQYIQLATTYVYNTIEEMKNAENLVNGSYVRTSGFYEYNDHGGANYKIRTITNEDTIDNIHLFALTNNETLVAELITPLFINLKQLGAKTLQDNQAIIQYALNNFNEIIINEMYEVYDKLTLSNINNIKIYGEGGLFINHSKAKNLLEISNCNNIIIEGLSFTNDDVRTGNTQPSSLYLIKGENINGLQLLNCKVYNAYNHAVELKKSKNIEVKNCEFKNCYYDMLTILTETSDVLVDNCIFDNITGSYINTYLFATGSNDYNTQVDYMTKNITVQNSKFLNNPNWEGIDSHGCKGFRVLNNYIFNCKEGIHYLYDKRTPIDKYLNSDVIIINNIIENPNISSSVKNGILVSGADINFVDNVIIENNIVKDFGGANSTYPINVEYAKNFIIKNNHITNMNVGGIQTAWCYNGIINDNIIKYPYNESAYGIRVNAYSWMIRCDNNYILGGTNSFQYGILVANYKSLAIFGHNFINGYKTARLESYSNSNTIIGEVTNSNNRRLGIKGVYSVDINDVPKSYCTDDVVRSIAETVSDITITAEAGDTLLSTLSSEDVTSKLCIGQEIIIPGAGSSGADLTTTIVDVIGIHDYKIKDAIETAVTSVHPSTTASTWANF